MRVDVQGLTVRYGDVTAIDDMSFSLEGNKIYGLLGRNGSGKASLMSVLACYRRAPGEVRLDGQPVFENVKTMRAGLPGPARHRRRGQGRKVTHAGMFVPGSGRLPFFGNLPFLEGMPGTVDPPWQYVVTTLGAWLIALGATWVIARDMPIRTKAA